MNFRTEIEVKPSKIRISHRSPMMLIGSCFTEYIGSNLSDLSFPVKINPSGIVYNPFSVFRTLEILVNGKEYTGSDLGYFNELWFSFDHHTSFSHPDQAQCLNKINNSIRDAMNFLKTTELLLITFGTSRIYKHKKSDRIVSNCHKIPASEFERLIMSTDEIVTLTKNMVSILSDFNPGLKFIFTISPVRHWKDGAVGNQINKAALILAVHKIIELFKDKAEYFPAYEFMLDDLRDYRFYADDLLHPGTQAVEYIWTKFSKTYFDDLTLQINKDLNSLNNALNHRPVLKETKAWKAFLADGKRKVETLAEKYPFLELEKYKKYFF